MSDPILFKQKQSKGERVTWVGSVGAPAEIEDIKLWAKLKGYALVPLDITEEMLEAGKTAHYDAEKEADEAFDDKGMGLRKNRAAHVYKAMIAAAQGEKDEHE